MRHSAMFGQTRHITVLKYKNPDYAADKQEELKKCHRFSVNAKTTHHLSTVKIGSNPNRLSHLE